MFNKKEKIALVIAGIEILGFGALAIYSYGRAKFYEGRVSATKDLTTELNKMKDEFDKKNS